MTLAQMASAIRNHVVDGLDGVGSTSFSMDQLKDEILLTSSTIIAKLSLQGLIEPGSLSQRIDGIRIECADISSNCEVETDIKVPHFTIPNLNRAVKNPISFLGSMESSLTFKVYFDRDYRYHKYRLATSKKPFAWVSTTAAGNGLFDVYLFNTGKYNNMNFISIDANFDNPYDLLKTNYYEQFASAEFYAPFYIQSEVIDTLTQKYVNYYRQLHMTPKPNTQQA